MGFSLDRNNDFQLIIHIGLKKNDIKFTISKTEDFDICTFCKSVH